MAQINLLNKGSASRFDVSRFLSGTLFWCVLLAFLAITGYYMYTFIQASVTNKRIIAVQDEIKKIQTEIQDNTRRDEVVTRQGQIAEYKTLDKNRLVWSNFIPELARITLNNVKYASITASAEGKIDLQAIAPSYEAVDQYLSVFEDSTYNRCITDVKLTTLGKAQSEQNLETRFGIQITYNPSMIKQSSDSDEFGGSGILCK